MIGTILWDAMGVIGSLATLVAVTITVLELLGFGRLRGEIKVTRHKNEDDQ